MEKKIRNRKTEFFERVKKEVAKVVTDKICLVVDDDGHICAWGQPFEIDGELKPSVGMEGMATVFVDKEAVPEANLSECVYKKGKVTFSQERADYIKQTIIRSERELEFSRYDKYQLPQIQKGMTEEQIDEYESWRQAWLDAPETMVVPDAPKWFD